ncbi:ABC transporter permease [Mucilaginibacter sp. RS28]|uniref:ABC transporter permease n=1 Tax=Mucilaginibacter straminoryzae TaxID=2932774 RepID=A0A9X2BEB9_9SPHI|nr:ABC transporter permease [Mucilaginibacter straminoryzae]MCJ8211248.1 ABC transporter permease [Mucilaginibacter straminoryzae]
MIKNYLKIAWRTLLRHKLFSFINIFGLATGMAVCILALIDIKTGYEYDKFHKHTERTYRVITELTGRNGAKDYFASTSYPVATDILNKYPFIENSVRVILRRTSFVKSGDDLPVTLNFTEPSFFKTFGFKILRGTYSNQPHAILITQKTAERFFGKDDVIGMIMHHKTYGDLIVTGILQDVKEKSHLQFDGIAAMETLTTKSTANSPSFDTADWTNPGSCYTYITLKSGASVQQLNRVLQSNSVIATRMIPANSGLKSIAFLAQPFASITPARHDYYNSAYGPTMAQLAAEGSVGLVTLFLAVFNYVNLTLARAITRSREVGIRKVIGARRWQLILQFVSESVLLSFCALVFSAVFIRSISNFNWIPKILEGAHWDGTMFLLIALLALFTGIVAGYLPARILSSFSPALVLKSHTGQPVVQRLTMRKILMVLQFVVSIVGVVFIIVMYRQSAYMARADYGFNRKNILNVELQGADYRLAVSELSKQPGVEEISGTSTVLGFNGGDISRGYRTEKATSFPTEVIAADQHFITTMGLHLTAGKNLLATDREVLINETASKSFHFKNPVEAINELVWINDSTQVRIAGVLKDFHFMSMHFEMMPLVIRNSPSQFTTLQLKINEGTDAAKLIEQLSQRWRKVNSKAALSAEWFDKILYEHHLHAEDQLFLAMFIGLALSIACLGLLGMVTYTAEVRIKEIGIRKVMGAGVGQIVYLLSSDFAKLLIIASVIAVPIGMVAGNIFLRNYAYHVNIGPWTVLITLLFLLLAGGLTIGLKAFRAASANPVKSLRNE